MISYHYFCESRTTNESLEVIALPVNTSMSNYSLCNYLAEHRLMLSGSLLQGA